MPYNGDRSRKETLVEYGFRLPPPLTTGLTLKSLKTWLTRRCLSAPPGPYERANSRQIVEQIIRPTGLVDPQVELRPVEGQIDHLVGEINQRVDKNQRVLVTTLTKKMAEDLTSYLKDIGVRVRYLHSDIDTLERMEIIRDLRLGKFDVLVDKPAAGGPGPAGGIPGCDTRCRQGRVLRSETSLIQTIGRAARNVDGKVVMYADRVTGSMKRAMDETERRRNKQLALTGSTASRRKHKKAVADIIEATKVAEEEVPYSALEDVLRPGKY